jgi:hypothetical protein
VLGGAAVATIAPGEAATVAADGVIAPGGLALPLVAFGATAGTGAEAAGGAARFALAPAAGADAGPATATDVGVASWRQPP